MMREGAPPGSALLGAVRVSLPIGDPSGAVVVSVLPNPTNGNCLTKACLKYMGCFGLGAIEAQRILPVAGGQLADGVGTPTNLVFGQ